VFAYKSCLFHQTTDFVTKIFSVVLLHYPQLFFFLNPTTQIQQQQQQQVSSNGLALSSSSNLYYCTSGPVLAGPGLVTAATSAGPSMPSAQAPATPASLTLEQQHITAVEGIVPTFQNIVATVNLDCHLNPKKLHYTPAMPSITQRLVQLTNMARLVHVCYLSSICIVFHRSHHLDL
jgi:hypothetical protein